MPNAMLHKSGSGDPEEQQQQPNANNNNHQHHHQHHDDDALRAQNAGDADSDADADSPAAGKSLNVDDRINGSGGAGGGGGGRGGGAGAGGVVGGRPALKEHDFVGGVGAGGGSGDEKRATVNGRSEVDFETELRLGPPSEAVAQAPKTRAASYEPKFFNNGHEVSGTPAAFLLPPAKNAGIGMAVVGAGAKRVFSELQGGATRMGLLQLPLPLDAVDGGGKGTLMYPWPPQQQQPQPSSSAEQQQQRVVLVSDSTHEVAKRPPLPPSAEFLNKNPSQSQSQSQSQSHNNNHHHGSRVAPVVGWPPIRSFRKNLAPQPKPGTEAQQQQQQAAANGSGCGSGNSHAPFAVVNHQQQQQHHHHHHHQLPHKSFPETMFVKVNMDGVAIGRKIDLKAFDGYAQFSQALEEMFKRFVTAQGNSQKPCDNVASESEQAQSYVFGGGDFVLTYEDNEGDRMLVGDVPWEMFVSTVKRLRIMKSAEAQCLAPRSPLKAQQGQLTQE